MIAINQKLMEKLQEDLDFAAEEATSWMYRARAHEAFLDFLSIKLQTMLSVPPSEEMVVHLTEMINQHLQANR